MSLQQLAVGFIGGGAMGGALIRRLAEQGLVSPHRLFLHEPDEERARSLAGETGLNLVEENRELLDRCQVLVLAVKPQLIGQVLEHLEADWRPGQTLISVAAGVSTSTLRQWLPQEVHLVRVMPNAPALVGAGASAVALEPGSAQDSQDLALEMFGAVGEAVAVPEQLLDAVTGVSGSGPAYAYLFMEAMADAGVREGLPRQTALELAAQTLRGAALMVLETGRHPGELKDMVTSPRGTTIEAVGVLEKAGFRGTVMEAVRAAAERARELGARKG